MEGSGSVSLQKVRRALTRYYDLNYLGTCPLASSLLTRRYPSPQEQGRALQQLLKEAIEYLQPVGNGLNSERLWRPYRVLYWTYIERLNRDEIMRKLSVSRATFYNEQRKGLVTVVEFLQGREESLRVPSVHPWPVPRVEHFVGREEELVSYRRQLEQKHFASIVGLAGAGKTSIGAELAAAWEAKNHRVIWISIREGRNTDMLSFLEALALALATQGDDMFWRFLIANRQRQAPLSLESVIHYLLTLLEQGAYTLCLDDFHLVIDNPAITSLCSDLFLSACQSKIWLLIISRVSIPFVHTDLVQPLSGLSCADARALLRVSGLSPLPEPLFDQLHTRTAGFPILLKLFAAWAHSQGLQHATDPETEERVAAFVNNLLRAPDARKYLLRQVYQTLTFQERVFLTCTSAFRTPFDTEKQSIIRLLRAEGVEDVEATWTALADRQVFTYIVERDATILHPLVREYFRQRLRMQAKERARIHCRVGEYYELHVGDIVEASYHYLESGKYERAVRLVSDNVTRLINAGQAEAALKRLEQLEPYLASMPTVVQYEATVAQEGFYYLLGQRETEQIALDRMLTLAETLDDKCRLAVTYNRQARFYSVQGEFPLVISAAQNARKLAQQAGDQEAEMESLGLWGRALWDLGDYPAARESLEQALILAQELGDSLAIAYNLNRLGSICLRLEDWSGARKLYERSLSIARAINDRRGEAAALNNLGLICRRSGDYSAAQTFYTQATSICQLLDDKRVEGVCLGNLAQIHRLLGNPEGARAFYEQALAIYRAVRDRQGEAITLADLGALCYDKEDYTTARAYHEQALAIQADIGDQWGIGSTSTYLGMALEALGDLDGAETAYRQALTIHREIGQDALAIEDVAGLARVALNQGRTQQAQQRVEECLAYLTTHDIIGIDCPFEIYLTCTRVLQVNAEHQRARAVLKEARALLAEQANRIGDEALRHSFLENVPAHRELLELCRVSCQPMNP